MRSSSEIWRQRAWVWVPALVFFLANASAYTVYRFGFADRVASLKKDLQDQKDQLDPLVGRKQKLESLLARSQRNKIEVEKLYSEKFSTRKQRLTSIIAEVKTLARKAGLDPTSVSYPAQPIEQYGLVKLSFIFSVEGTYLELRNFINLLELSPSFLTLEEVTLSESGGGRPTPGRGAPQPAAANPGEELRINLNLSTLFARNPNAPDDLALPPVPRRAQS
jgi:Tfp pilus assembly protein PilO